MPYKRCFAIALLILGFSILGFVTTAHAGTSMYTGSLLIHGFGNDTTTGKSWPKTTFSVTGHPWGPKDCNTRPFHAQSTLTWVNHCTGGTKGCVQTTLPTSVSTTVSVTLPDYGGQLADITKHGAPATGTAATRAAGCSVAAEQAGTPLTAAGPAITTGTGTGRGFTLPASDFVKVTSGGSWPVVTVYLFGIEDADLRNQTGSFGKGQGPGDFSLQFTTGGGAVKPAGKVVGKAGPNRFGGVMQLLGYYGDKEGFATQGHISVASFDWQFDKLGGSAVLTTTGPGTKVAQGGLFGTATNTNITTDKGKVNISTVKASVFPWTTGTVSLTATRGPFPTIMQRKGYDNRDSNGVGTIQLVSPMLTRWRQVLDYETGAIGVLSLVFTPEPQEWMMLASGVSLLALLYRANRRRSG